MDSTTIIRAFAGMFFLAFLGLFIVIAIFYVLTLTRALNKCSLTSRTIQPGTLWILLVPFVNLVWHFFVVLGMANSLGNEFRARNFTTIDPEPGKSLGLAMCICGVCGFIPILGVLAGLAYLVLWIIYWIKINEFSHMLDQIPVAGVPPMTTQAF